MLPNSDPDLILIEQLASTPATKKTQFLFAHPQLLSPAFLLRVSTHLDLLRSPNRDALKRAINYAREVLTSLTEGRVEYSLGGGPIEKLCDRLRLGEVTIIEALNLAATPDFSAMISPIYGGKLTSRAEELLSDPTTDTEGLSLLRLLGAAVHAGPSPSETSPELRKMRLGYDYDWLNQAGQYLIQHADGRIYQEALLAGERLLNAFVSSEWQGMRGKTLYRLGTLHLYPYIAGRNVHNFRAEHGRWVGRFLQEHGEELVTLPKDTWEMPDPVDALSLAETHFRRASSLLTNSLLGRCLADLAETQQWLQEIGATHVNPGEFRRHCYEALRLTESEGPMIRLKILRILARSGERVSREMIGSVVQELGNADDLDHATFLDAMYQTTNLLGDIDPIGALAGAVGLRDSYARDPVRTRVSFWELELKLIYRIWRECIGENPPVDGIAAEAARLANGEGYRSMQERPVEEGLIALSVAAEHWGLHADAIPVIETLVQLTPELAAAYDCAITLLRGDLRFSAAGKAFKAEDWATAVALNTEAAEFYLSLDDFEQAMSCLQRIYDLADRGRNSTGVARASIQALHVLAVPLQIALGDRGLNAVNSLCNRILNIYGKTMGTEAAFVVCQIAKGLRFGVALRSGARYIWQRDQVGLRLLDEVFEAEMALPSETVDPRNAPGDDSLLEEEFLLGAYIGSIEQQPGITARQRFANLQRSFDRHVSDALLFDVGKSAEGPPVYVLKRYQALLDERTVLAYLYLGDRDGMIAIYSFLLTRDKVLSYCIPYDLAGTMQISTPSGDRRAELDLAGIHVGLVRKHLLETPEGQRVSSEAASLLENGIGWFFGSKDVLDELRLQGKDHLCIVPHGAFHYLPFHLLGKANQPLAAEWTVTYLPHPVLLFNQSDPSASTQEACRSSAVVGLDYQHVNPYHLAELPQSSEELIEVAAVLGVAPTLEDDATEAAVLNALTGARMVHLSMHGRHNVAAPSFQCLYTAQGQEEDGRLNAYELLSADLSQLQLLTLSACETALGRFDVGDNLRGLPASLFLGGVSSIIGTLWSVDADASRFFFITLYTALKAGSSRLEAFAGAQRATRRRFPRYQDWGAFCLVGEWS